VEFHIGDGIFNAPVFVVLYVRMSIHTELSFVSKKYQFWISSAIVYRLKIMITEIKSGCLIIWLESLHYYGLLWPKISVILLLFSQTVLELLFLGQGAVVTYDKCIPAKL
jgi:hypothetical protein